MPGSRRRGHGHQGGPGPAAKDPRAEVPFPGQPPQDQVLRLQEARVLQGVGDLEDEALAAAPLEQEILVALAGERRHEGALQPIVLARDDDCLLGGEPRGVL